MSAPRLCRAGGRRASPVPGHDLALAIDQDRDIKAEDLDALGDLPDLLLGVAPWVSRIRFELSDCPVDDRYPKRKAGRLATRCAKVVHQRFHFALGLRRRNPR